MERVPVDVQHVDVAARAAEQADGVLWSWTGQLQSNVVALPSGGRVGEHVEPALDVLLVVVAGSGQVVHGEPPVEQDVVAPAVVVLPAGTRRSLAAGPAGLVVVTAHRPRPPLLPGRRA